MLKVVTFHKDQTVIRMTAKDQEAALDAAIRATGPLDRRVWTPAEQELLAKYVLWSYQRLSAVAQVVADNNL